MTYVIPVVSVALGVLALHERLQWPQLLGAAVVIGAALLIGRPPRRGGVRAAAAELPDGGSGAGDAGAAGCRWRAAG